MHSIHIHFILVHVQLPPQIPRKLLRLFNHFAIIQFANPFLAIAQDWTDTGTDLLKVSLSAAIKTNTAHFPATKKCTKITRAVQQGKQKQGIVKQKQIEVRPGRATTNVMFAQA